MTISRSSTRGVERVLVLIGWRPYRCLACHRRFYDRPVREIRADRTVPPEA
jgi:hypothetical protein